MRAGKMGSFLSWAVSTRILRGPLGQSTASRSEETTAEIIQTGAVNQDKDAGGNFHVFILNLLVSQRHTFTSVTTYKHEL